MRSQKDYRCFSSIIFKYHRDGDKAIFKPKFLDSQTATENFVVSDKKAQVHELPRKKPQNYQSKCTKIRPKRLSPKHVDFYVQRVYHFVSTDSHQSMLLSSMKKTC